MSLSRKEFITGTFKTITVISFGNVLQSFNASDFTLPSVDRIKLRFAMASDGHYGQSGTNFDEFHDDMISWINKDHEKRPIDFTMFNGDLVHDDHKFFSEVKKKYEQLNMPFYVSHGNHDKCDPDTWEKAWNKSFNYSFELKDAAFVVLDTADDTGVYVCPELNWTKRELEKYKRAKQLFVFMHITPVKWTKHGISCPEIVDLFRKQKNLKAIFHGHDHDQDNIKQDGGKSYFFDSHIGGNWGTAYRGYRVVEVLTTGEVLTYQVNPLTASRVNHSKI